MLDAAAPVPMLQSATADFVENLGQWDADIHYLYRTGNANVAFTDQGLSFVGFQPGADGADILAETVNMRFEGAVAVAPIGLDPTPGRFNYHVGADASRWINGAHAFATVAYEGLYDGVDLFVSGSSANLTYEYHLAAGADPADIVVRYDGAEDITIDESGALHVALGAGELIDDAPISYQDINGVRTAVDSAFAIGDDGAVTFTLGAYDPSAALVIDPSVGWGAYIGGGSGDTGFGVAIDAFRCVYATGRTYSTGWIAGGFDTTYGGNADAFVAKYSRKGVKLWSTYLGGAQEDVAYGITVSSAGALYVVGSTRSTAWTSGGVGDHSYNDNGDGFVAKLRRTGSHAWSCYLGGSESDQARAVACSTNEAVHIAGRTLSSGWITKGWDTSYAGGTDGFYARLWINGKSLRGSYLGGSQSDSADDIAVDGRDDVLICGTTSSAGWVKKGQDTSYGGNEDGFLTKFATTGKHLWSRFLGGTTSDSAFGVTIGQYNKIYVAGHTYSAGWIAGGADTSYNSGGDGFVYAMKTTGVHLWSTYLGGSAYERGKAVTTDANGDVYVVGSTTSSGWTVGGWDTSHNGNTDGFVARFTAMGTFRWSSHFGGGQEDWPQDVAPDTFNGVHIVGWTDSAGWLTGGFDNVLNGTSDAFTLWAKG